MKIYELITPMVVQLLMYFKHNLNAIINEIWVLISSFSFTK